VAHLEGKGGIHYLIDLPMFTAIDDLLVGS